MALTPQSNEAFLREVDDELRRDQLLSFWERYGRWLIGAVVVGLLLFAGVLYWQHRQRLAAGAEDEKLQAAFDSIAADDSAKAAAPLTDLAQSKRDGYRALARFAQADVLLAKRDTAGAAALFGQVAGDGSMAQPFRDLALVRQTAAEYDTLKPEVVRDRLRALTVPGSAWFGSAGEMTAVAYLRMGRRDLAATLFGQIGSNQDVPPPIRQRAVQMAALLSAGAAAPNEDTKTR